MKNLKHNFSRFGIATALLLTVVNAVPALTQSSVASEPGITQSVVQLAQTHSHDAKEMVQSIEFILRSFEKALDAKMSPSQKIKFLNVHLRIAQKGIDQNRDQMPKVLADYFTKKISETASDIRQIEMFTMNPSIAHSKEYGRLAVARIRSRIQSATWIIATAKPLMRFL